jgi:hypothetical protein
MRPQLNPRKQTVNLSNNLSRLLIVSLTALGSFSVSAIEFRDIDHPNKLLTAGGPDSSYTGDFNLISGDGDGPFNIGSPYVFTARGTFSEAAGFDPNTMQAISGTLSLWVKDNTDTSSDAYSVDLGSFTGFTSGANFGTWRYEAPGLPVDILVAINDTGHLSYTVTATGGDFILDYAMLKVQAVSAVPDSAMTGLLFGFTFLGLAAFRQRLVKH